MKAIHVIYWVAAAIAWAFAAVVVLAFGGLVIWGTYDLAMVTLEALRAGDYRTLWLAGTLLAMVGGLIAVSVAGAMHWLISND